MLEIVEAAGAGGLRRILGFKFFQFWFWFVEIIQIGHPIEQNLCLLNLVWEKAIAGVVGNYL